MDLVIRVINVINQEKKLKFLQMQKSDVNKEENVEFDKLKQLSKV